MKCKWWLLGVFLLLQSPVYTQGLIDAYVDRVAGKYVKKSQNHALMIGVIYADRVEIKGYGAMSVGQSFAPDVHTLFEIGDVSSIFTTSAMMLDVREGLISLDARVCDYLPPDVGLPNYHPFTCRLVDDDPLVVDGSDYSRMVCEPDPDLPPLCISFCDLASHTSGLSKSPKGFYYWNPLGKNRQNKGPYETLNRVQLYENLSRHIINVPPGTIYQYSSTGIAVLGHVLADLHHKTYADYLHDRLLQPLGLRETFVQIPAADQSRFAIGHDRRGRAVAHWDFNAMAPAAGLRSSASDLVVYMQAQLRRDESVWHQAFSQAQQARIEVPRRKYGRETMGGYGWLTSILSDKSNLPAVWINGGTAGFSSFLGMQHDHKIAIILLSNSARSVDAIGFELLEYLALNPPGKPATPGLDRENLYP